MLDQMQTVLPLLSALLAHPEFVEGVQTAQQYFVDDYGEAPLSEEQMIEEVEINLSRRVVANTKRFCAMTGTELPSYLCDLGYVLGTIGKGLTYTLPATHEA